MFALHQFLGKETWIQKTVNKFNYKDMLEQFLILIDR